MIALPLWTSLPSEKPATVDILGWNLKLMGKAHYFQSHGRMVPGPSAFQTTGESPGYIDQANRNLFFFGDFAAEEIGEGREEAGSGVHCVQCPLISSVGRPEVL